MITLTVEAILVVLLVLVLMQFFKKKPETSSLPQPDLANLKPTDAIAGDVISISGAGDDFNDLDFTADRCTWVQAGVRHWSELIRRPGAGSNSSKRFAGLPTAPVLKDRQTWTVDP